MPLGEIFVAITFALQMTIAVTFGLKSKRGWRNTLLLFLVATMGYVSIMYCDLQEHIWVLAYIIELVILIVCTGFFSYGNQWRNFFIVWINFQCTNLIYSIIGIIIKYVTGKHSSVFIRASYGVKQVVLEMIVIVAISFPVCRLMNSLFSKEYYGDGKLYKIFLVVIYTYGSASGILKRILINEAAKVDYTDYKTVMLIYVVSIASIVTAVYILGSIHGYVEAKHLHKVNVQLGELIQSNYRQYQEVTQNNAALKSVKIELDKYQQNVSSISADDILKEYANELKDSQESLQQSLSGSLAVDALISNYSTLAKEKGIVMECCIAPLYFDLDRDMKLTAVLGNLFEVALESCVKASTKPWINLNIRKNSDNIVIKMEYSKSVDTKSTFKTKTEKRLKPMEIIRAITHMEQGTMNVKDLGKEACIDVLLI